MPLAFRHLPRAVQRRAWAWAYGAEARSVARFDSFPRIDVLACACDVAGAEVAPRLAAIEARLGARVAGGAPAPSVAVV